MGSGSGQKLNITNMQIPIITPLLLNGLILFYKFLGENLGVAIIIFSLVLVFSMRPLTKPYMESMKKIRALEPQLAKLRSKFGKDKMKMSQAQAELYKQNKINPMSGCLPYILQFVILLCALKKKDKRFPKTLMSRQLQWTLISAYMSLCNFQKVKF